MKLSAHAFTRFWDLHAWAGVTGGLVLHVMFLAGAITLFHQELETWEEPLAQQQAAATGSDQVRFERAIEQIDSKPDSFWFYPRATGAAQIGYTDPETETWQRMWVDGEDGALIAERERLSGFLYELHFLWHDLTGDGLYYLSGVLAVLLLLAVATGVLIHVKDIARQFHQFRPDRSPRVLWSDMHKVLGVMGLPFQILYAYTGALIVLGPILFAAFVDPVFDGDRQRAETVVMGRPELSPEHPGEPAATLSLDELAQRARDAEPRLEAESYRILYPGHENGLVDVRGPIRGTTPQAYGAVRLDQTDGSVVRVDSPASETAAGATWRWVRGLHYAYFGGLPLRLLFFVLALATSATILTGNWVWLARRATRGQHAGRRVLSRLTAGIGAGAIVAVAALFLVSRLLPLGLASRGAIEELVFCFVLVCCVVWACTTSNEHALWWRQLGVAGTLLLPVPPLAARWTPSGLFGPGPRIADVAGVDLAILAVALLLCGSALWLRRAAKRRAGRADGDATASTVDAHPAIAPTAEAGGRDA